MPNFQVTSHEVSDGASGLNSALPFQIAQYTTINDKNAVGYENEFPGNAV
jgi:hypothetical protein